MQVRKPVQAHSCMPAFTYVKKKLNCSIYTDKCLNPECTSRLGEFVQLSTLTQLPPRGEESIASIPDGPWHLLPPSSLVLPHLLKTLF